MTAMAPPNWSIDRGINQEFMVNQKTAGICHLKIWLVLGLSLDQSRGRREHDTGIALHEPAAGSTSSSSRCDGPPPPPTLSPAFPAAHLAAHATVGSASERTATRVVVLVVDLEAAGFSWPDPVSHRNLVLNTLRRPLRVRPVAPSREHLSAMAHRSLLLSKLDVQAQRSDADAGHNVVMNLAQMQPSANLPAGDRLVLAASTTRHAESRRDHDARLWTRRGAADGCQAGDSQTSDGEAL